MTSSSEVHDKGDPLSKLLELTLLKKFISIVMFIINGTNARSAFPCLCLTKGFPNVLHLSEPLDRTKSKMKTVELCYRGLMAPSENSQANALY